MEQIMRMQIPFTALGLALAAGVPAANAQSVITQQIVNQPVDTIETVETVRTVGPATRIVVDRQVVTTRRTVLRQRVVPMRTVIASSATYPLYDQVGPAYPRPLYDRYQRPLYDQVGPAYRRPLYNQYQRPLYDQVGTAYQRPLYNAVLPAAVESIVTELAAVRPSWGPTGTAYSLYRYVYEPDRILVVDPYTNIAVQAIPR
jgi:hypothetical protein